VHNSVGTVWENTLRYVDVDHVDTTRSWERLVLFVRQQIRSWHRGQVGDPYRQPMLERAPSETGHPQPNGHRRARTTEGLQMQTHRWQTSVDF